MWKRIISSRWRAVVVAVVFWIVLYVALVQLLSFLPSLETPWHDVRNGVVGTVIALGVTAVFLRGKREAFDDVGLWWSRATLPRFFVGLFVGTVIFGMMLSLLVAFAALEINTRAAVDYDALLLGCMALVPLAFMEEIAFRAYSFRLLYTTYGLWGAQVMTAIAFGVYHVGYGWSVAAAFSGPFVWAFVFGLGAVLSRGVAVPTGIHVALNVGQLLVGMKGEVGLWKLSFVAGAGDADRAWAEMVGMGLQGVVLVCGVLVTGWWYRR